MRIGNKDILFCDICPATYAISETKEKIKRNVKDAAGNEKFAHGQTDRRLRNVVSTHSNHLIKKGKGIDPACFAEKQGDKH